MIGFALDIRDFGNVGPGADCLPALNAALAEAESSGVKTICWPYGKFGFSDEIAIGNGGEGQESTIHHGVRIVGAGLPGVSGLTAKNQNGGTQFYSLSSSHQKAVVRIKGPILNIGLEGILLDCAGLAGFGLRNEHGAFGRFDNVWAIGATNAAWVLTARNNPAVPYGTADNLHRNCCSWMPATEWAHGLVLKMDRPANVPISGPVTTTRNHFTGGTWNYGGGYLSKGVWLQGASGNKFDQTYLHPKTMGSGWSVYFDRPTASPVFPYENKFENLEALQQPGGLSGTYGNSVEGWATGDGQPLPVMPYVKFTTALS